MDQIEKTYDQKYRTPNFFGDRLWLYRPFVAELVRKAELNAGSRLLDAGCGQGFFTALFAEQGVKALGVDVSSVGIEAANQAYHTSGARFEVGDVLRLSPQEKFDCVFTRSCSLYNSDEFAWDTAVTERLLSYVRPGGVLIFDYYTRLARNARADTWRYHSLSQAQEHFSKFRSSEVYFSLRLDAKLLGRIVFSRAATRFASVLSTKFDLGGELVAFVHV
jgi:SAM-dependent methyltransferase